MTEQTRSSLWLIQDCSTEADTVRTIRALRENELWSPTEFTLCVELTVPVLLELYLTFVHFELKGILWESLDMDILFDFSIDVNHLLVLFGDVMRVAHRAGLFKTIQFLGDDLEDPVLENLQMLPSVEKNQRLERFEIHRLYLTADDVYSLSCALQHPTCLKDITISSRNVDTQDINDTLSEGLANNSTLIRAIFRHEKSNHLVRALIGHPTLQELNVTDTDVNTDNYLEALPDLLASDNCHLEILTIGESPDLVDSMFTENLLLGLKSNKSLKKLKTSTCFPGDRPVSRLMSVWKTHPRLQHVELNQDVTIEDIKEARAGPRFSRRVFFGNFFMEKNGSQEYIAAVKDLLDTHPEICWGHCCPNSPEPVRFPAYLNRAGRYLMHRDIPPALWALVLAKINTQPKRSYGISRLLKASAVYEFLHGKALAGRQ